MANRNNTFLLKRSNIAGKVPAGGSLLLGELGLNTSDVILYASGTTSNSIIPIGWDRVARTGDTMSGGLFTPYLSASTISATTYYNLPIDVYTTGGTYNNNTFTFTNNTGGTFSTLFNTLTGITVNGDVLISGSSLPNGFALSVTGDTNFTGDVYVSGDITYNGDLLVTGGTIIQSGLTANTIYTDYIDFNTNYTGQTLPAGRLQWDDGNGTLVLGLKGGLSNMEIGLENMALCYNAEATTLTAGTIVYVSGSQGNRPSIKRAIATSDGYSVTTLGVVSESIASGAEGFVTTFGMVNNLNTIGLSGGTPIWLSPTVSGGYTNIKPQAPYHTVLLGYAVRIHASVGSVFVHISNGWEIDELHDVRLNGRTQGDLLTYSGYNGSNVWVNSKTLNGSYTITGDTTVGGGLTASTISATTIYGNNLTITGGTQSWFSGDSSSDLVRITQTGSGNALVIEDANNPDSTPFVVNNAGNLGIGISSPTNPLHISASTDQIRLSNGSSAWTIASKSNGDFVAVASGTRSSIYFGSYGVTNSVRIGSNGAIIVNSPSDSQFTGAGNVFVSNTLSATTISATTYQNLPQDIFVTGGTYTASTATFTNNTGGTFSVSGFSTNFTGGTVNGTTTFTSGLSANTITADTITTFIPTFSNLEIFRGITLRNNSTTIDTYGGVTMSTSASNLAQSVTSTSFVSKQIRLRYYASVVSGGRYTGTRGSALLWFIGGGFRYVCDFNISDTAFASGCQQFYGVAGQTTDLAYGGVGLIQVSTLTNLIGLGNDGSDTNLQIIHNDASGTATKIDLGINFPANRTVGSASTTVYSLTLYNIPASNDVKYMVVNNETGAIAMGIITTNLPDPTQGLNFFASRAMGGGGGVTNSGQFDLLKLGVNSLL